MSIGIHAWCRTVRAMSDTSPRPAGGPLPRRVARTDQQLAKANDRVDQLLAQYREVVVQDGVTAAAWRQAQPCGFSSNTYRMWR